MSENYNTERKDIDMKKLLATRILFVVLVLSMHLSIAAALASDASQTIVGSWGYFGDKTLPQIYIFNQDDSFLHYSGVVRYAYSAYEFVYKGIYRVNGNAVVFENVSISRFDRQNDNANRNKIGDRAHAKDMLNTTAGFEPWSLDPVEFSFMETGVARIARSNDTDSVRTVFRADWETYDRW